VHLVLTLTAERSYTIVGVEENQSMSGQGPHKLQRNTFQERWICGLHEFMRAIAVANANALLEQPTTFSLERTES